MGFFSPKDYIPSTCAGTKTFLKNSSYILYLYYVNLILLIFHVYTYFLRGIPPILFCLYFSWVRFYSSFRIFCVFFLWLFIILFLNNLTLSISRRPTRPPNMLNIVWWCSRPISEAKGALGYFPII